MKQLLLVAVLFVACSETPNAPQVYSWQDCSDAAKPNAVRAFEGCLSQVGLYSMSSYPLGERMSPRDCEQYAIQLYCVPPTQPQCESEIIREVNAVEKKQQKLKRDYDELSDKFNSCKTREREYQDCPGFVEFVVKCSKTQHVTVEAPDDPTPSN